MSRPAQKRNVLVTGRDDIPLSEAEHRFAEEYVVDLVASRAARRAGWPPQSAKTAGNRLLKRPAIIARIRQLQAERAARVEVTSDYVLQKTKEVLERALAEVRPALHPVTRRQLNDEEGNPLFTYNATAALRALELLGKHVDVQAFEERVELNAGQSLIEILQARGRQVSREPIDISPSRGADHARLADARAFTR